jgi:hypothetical protein
MVEILVKEVDTDSSNATPRNNDAFYISSYCNYWEEFQP